MKTEHLIITIFVGVNLVFGYLFQLQHGVQCMMELGILSICGAMIWYFALPYIQSYALWVHRNPKVGGTSYLILGGSSIGLSIIHLLCCQGILMLIMWNAFGCHSPAFSTLNASFTNSLLGNIVCCLSLCAYALPKNRVSHFSSNNQPSQATRNTQGLAVAPYIFLSHAGTKECVPISSIQYIKSARNCIVITTRDRRYVKYQSLTSFLRELPSHSFKRIHRSTLVNLQFLKHVESNRNGDGVLILKSGEKLKFSRNYRKELFS